ncbi:MAG: EMC3/TMCO1 family protein [Nanoarchaeota archaeon]
MDPLSTFIFSLPPIASIAIVALGVTLFTTLVYKFVTDQAMMKTLKSELKELQNLMKTKRDNPQEMMKIQKQAMEKNMEYMRHSMKPTLFTMIPLILLFGWLNSHIAFYPLMPEEPFDVWATFPDDVSGTVLLEIQPNVQGVMISSENPVRIEDGEARFEVTAPEGEYTLQYTLNDDDATAEQEILVTDEQEYKNPEKPIRGGSFKTLHVSNEKIEPLSFLGIGWGWIWSYIILSILFSTVIRKLLKIS